MTTTDITARAIAIARQDTGVSAAEFDHRIKIGGIGGPYSPLGNAIYRIATEHLPEIQHGDGKAELDRRDRLAADLFERLRPELEAYEQRCRSRQYVGWSRHSTGPIRVSGSAPTTIDT